MQKSWLALCAHYRLLRKAVFRVKNAKMSTNTLFAAFHAVQTYF